MAKKRKAGSRAANNTPKPKAAAKPAPGVAKREWGAIRRMLVEKREETLKTMRKIQALDMDNETGDEADQAGQSLEKELQFELSDNERNLLDQIEGALRKMDKGTYGLCEQCRTPIRKMRIKALPFARYCIECQNTAEKAAPS